MMGKQTLETGHMPKKKKKQPHRPEGKVYV